MISKKKRWTISAIFVLIVICLFSFDRNYDKDTLAEMLSNGTTNDKIMASVYIGDTKDTSMYGALLLDGCNPAISHHYKYLGMNIYYIKMHTMKKNTGVEPPVKITHNVDSTVYSFYLNIAEKKGWMQTWNAKSKK